LRNFSGVLLQVSYRRRIKNNNNNQLYRFWKNLCTSIEWL